MKQFKKLNVSNKDSSRGFILSQFGHRGGNYADLPQFSLNPLLLFHLPMVLPSPQFH